MAYTIMKFAECAFLFETVFIDRGRELNQAFMRDFKLLDYKLLESKETIDDSFYYLLEKKDQYSEEEFKKYLFFFTAGFHRWNANELYLAKGDDKILDCDDEDSARLLFELGEY